MLFGSFVYLLKFLLTISLTIAIEQKKILTGDQNSQAPIKDIDQSIKEKWTNIIKYQKYLKEPTKFINDVIADLERILGKNYYIQYLITKASGHLYKAGTSKYSDRNPYSKDIMIYHDPHYSASYDRYGPHHNQVLYKIFSVRYNLSDKQILTDSEFSKEKLKTIYNIESKIQKTDCNIYALEANNNDDIVEIAKCVDLYPSNYQIIKALYPIETQNNNELCVEAFEKAINNLKDSKSFAKIKHKKHIHIIYNIIYNAISGLIIEAKKFKHKTRFALKILEKIQQVLDFIAVYDLPNETSYETIADYSNILSKRYTRTTLLYEFLNDLIFVFLSYQKPYTQNNYEQEFNKSSTEKFGKTLNYTNFPMKSGMDALTTALILFGGENKDTKVEILDISKPIGHLLSDASNIYFEFSHILSAYNKFRDNADKKLFLIGISSETDFNNLSINALVKTITQYCDSKKQHAVVLIDSTIELEKSIDPTYHLIQQLKPLIEQKAISVVLCKSLQKFMTLGTTKVKAGNITVISKKLDQLEKLSNIAQNNFISHLEEFQFIIHLLKYNYKNEESFVDKASRNAFFISGLLKKLCNIDSASNGPFLFIPGDPKTIAPLINDIPPAETFGYTFTTTSNFNFINRISIGLEPLVLLLKKFNILNNDSANDINALYCTKQ